MYFESLFTLGILAIPKFPDPPPSGMGSPKSILLPPCFVYISNEWPVALLACRIDLLISSLYRNPQLGGTIRDTEASPPPTRSHEVKDTTRRASYNGSTRAYCAPHGPSTAHACALGRHVFES